MTHFGFYTLKTKERERERESIQLQCCMLFNYQVKRMKREKKNALNKALTKKLIHFVQKRFICFHFVNSHHKMEKMLKEIEEEDEQERKVGRKKEKNRATFQLKY